MVEISSKPRPLPWNRPPRAYVAQTQGLGVSGGRPQRHVEHDDAIHDNERGNNHDENEVPEEPEVRDVTASPCPRNHRERRSPLTSQTTFRRGWSETPELLL